MSITNIDNTPTPQATATDRSALSNRAGEILAQHGIPKPANAAELRSTLQQLPAGSPAFEALLDELGTAFGGMGASFRAGR
ncbi:MAG: hypothetical protein RIT81_06155 [Deltaproteobacteria bacterium]